MTKNLRNLTSWLFSLADWKKRAIKIAFDATIVPVSLLISFIVRLETFDFLYLPDFYISVVIATITALAIFNLRGLYSTLTRYVSTEVGITILTGSVGAASLLFVGKFLANIWIPISVPFIFLTTLCLLATSSRFVMRALGLSLNPQNRKNIIIYGAGAAGTQLMEALKLNPGYRVCMFIDDNKRLHGRTVAGIPIKSFDQAKKALDSLEIESILLAIRKVDGKTRKKISELLLEYHFNLKTIPSISDQISGLSDIAELPNINIEDLLGRDPVKPDPKLMAKSITDKTVLVTGAGGSIGSELCRQILRWSPLNLVILDISEFSVYKIFDELGSDYSNSTTNVIPLIGSVQDSHFISNVMSLFRIDTIYHAAAYKHVPLMEMNIMQCISNNVLGTHNIAKQAMEAKVSDFILISTDKAVNPKNFMGASKRFAELICQYLTTKQSNTRFTIVRFGNVLGSSGSVVPLFSHQIEKGGPVTLTHRDMTRYFMTISEASQLVIQAGAISCGGQTFVLDMGKPNKIIDLAKKMIILSGFTPTLKEEKTFNTNYIQIKVIGLRPGEKLFEELSYSSHMKKTVHPRIMQTIETEIPSNDFKILLSNIPIAINEKNYNKLFQIIASVSGGIPNLDESMDIFLKQDKFQGDMRLNNSTATTSSKE